MTKEQFGKGSPLISMSDIDPQKPNQKKCSNYHELKCKITLAGTITNCSISLLILDTRTRLFSSLTDSCRSQTR